MRKCPLNGNLRCRHIYTSQNQWGFSFRATLPTYTSRMHLMFSCGILSSTVCHDTDSLIFYLFGDFGVMGRESCCYVCYQTTATRCKFTVPQWPSHRNTLPEIHLYRLQLCFPFLCLFLYGLWFMNSSFVRGNFFVMMSERCYRSLYPGSYLGNVLEGCLLCGWSGRLLYDGMNARRSIGGLNCSGIDIRWKIRGLYWEPGLKGEHPIFGKMVEEEWVTDWSHDCGEDEYSRWGRMYDKKNCQ